ncbi:MAG TPA: EthD family reductase [Bryobacteraceae bacterium]|jgi:uncharacterized protein (TIGR02118 family)
MAQLLVLYNQPADAAAFDRHYFTTHVPIAKKIPGLRSYAVSSGKPTMVAGTVSPYLIAELEFDTMEALQAAMASPEGQAAAADVANFAHAGVTLLVFDTRKL